MDVESLGARYVPVLKKSYSRQFNVRSMRERMQDVSLSIKKITRQISSVKRERNAEAKR